MTVHDITSNGQTQLVTYRKVKGKLLHSACHICFKPIHRYINMDYRFFSSMLLASTLQVINISYDIACQWSKNLWRRMSAFSSQYHLDHSTKTITFLVPKFHLPVHVLSCQITYLFNFIKGVGRTDGEAPECG